VPEPELLPPEDALADEPDELLDAEPELVRICVCCGAAQSEPHAVCADGLPPIATPGPVALVCIAVNDADRPLGLASLNPFQLARGAMKNS
jgi:hypothetical protein